MGLSPIEFQSLDSIIISVNNRMTRTLSGNSSFASTTTESTQSTSYMSQMPCSMATQNVSQMPCSIATPTINEQDTQLEEKCTVGTSTPINGTHLALPFLVHVSSTFVHFPCTFFLYIFLVHLYIFHVQIILFDGTDIRKSLFKLSKVWVTNLVHKPSYKVLELSDRL